MGGWTVVLRGIRYRSGRSMMVLLLAAVATAATVLAPAYARAAQQSVLSDRLADAPVNATGLHLSSDPLSGDGRREHGRGQARGPATAQPDRHAAPPARHADRVGRRAGHHGAVERGGAGPGPPGLPGQRLRPRHHDPGRVHRRGRRGHGQRPVRGRPEAHRRRQAGRAGQARFGPAVTVHCGHLRAEGRHRPVLGPRWVLHRRYRPPRGRTASTPRSSRDEVELALPTAAVTVQIDYRLKTDAVGLDDVPGLRADLSSFTTAANARRLQLDDARCAGCSTTSTWRSRRWAGPCRWSPYRWCWSAGSWCSCWSPR